jgi:hypothetical protein
MDVRLNDELVNLWQAFDHESEILENCLKMTRSETAALESMQALERHGYADARCDRIPQPLWFRTPSR